MSFTVIETQEDLDKIINERLARERESSAKKYEGYLSPDDVAKKYEGYISPGDLERMKTDYDNQISGLNSSIETIKGEVAKDAETIAAKDKEISERDAKIKGYEAAALRSRIAHEAGLPYGMADRLKGEKEEDIKNDAQALSKLIVHNKTAPYGSPEPIETGDRKKDALRNLAARLDPNR